ncbi:hypothetical protein ACGFR6_36510 [Streptomyces sp. NPDC048567]|uniref:hypothetical protein n=1 Tax=Streptomyces sp. NPDC048567 TaxID=3365570 RepID=UPI00371EC3C0
MNRTHVPALLSKSDDPLMLNATDTDDAASTSLSLTTMHRLHKPPRKRVCSAA